MVAWQKIAPLTFLFYRKTVVWNILTTFLLNSIFWYGAPFSMVGIAFAVKALSFAVSLYLQAQLGTTHFDFFRNLGLSPIQLIGLVFLLDTALFFALFSSQFIFL